MRVAEPLGHGELVRGLWRAARAGRLSHALLLEGREGIGRFLAAKWLAQGLFCAEGPGSPCGACGPCKRVASGGHAGNHPDLLVVDPLEHGSERIPLAWIADRPGEDAPVESAEAFLRLVPSEGGWRVVVVREAGRMLPNAQSALLKTLEEPRPGTLILLECANPDRLLPTIRSRCVRVAFDSLSREDCAAVLAGVLERPEHAERVARWSRGSPGVALGLERSNAAAMREEIAGVLSGERAPLSASAARWGGEVDLPAPTRRAAQRERARAALDLALAVVADLVRAGAGVPADALAHGDLAARIGGLSRGGLERALDRLLEARADLEGNLTPELVVERCMLILDDARGTTAAAAGVERAAGRPTDPPRRGASETRR